MWEGPGFRWCSLLGCHHAVDLAVYSLPCDSALVGPLHGRLQLPSGRGLSGTTVVCVEMHEHWLTVFQGCVLRVPTGITAANPCLLCRQEHSLYAVDWGAFVTSVKSS
jgi:hypothetical protein